MKSIVAALCICTLASFAYCQSATVDESQKIIEMAPDITSDNITGGTDDTAVGVEIDDSAASAAEKNEGFLDRTKNWFEKQKEGDFLSNAKNWFSKTSKNAKSRADRIFDKAKCIGKNCKDADEEPGPVVVDSDVGKTRKADGSTLDTTVPDSGEIVRPKKPVSWDYKRPDDFMRDEAAGKKMNAYGKAIASGLFGLLLGASMGLNPLFTLVLAGAAALYAPKLLSRFFGDDKDKPYDESKATKTAAYAGAAIFGLAALMLGGGFLLAGAAALGGYYLGKKISESIENDPEYEDMEGSTT
ncbi:hypothetical protein ACFL6Y_00330 [Elusimicrobiota bacterium]